MWLLGERGDVTGLLAAFDEGRDPLVAEERDGVRARGGERR